MENRTVSERPDEKVATVGAIIQKWRNVIVLGLELHSRMAMRKVAYRPKTTWQELVNDSKACLTTIAEKTSGNTPRRDAGFLLRKARPTFLRHLSES